MASTLPDFPKFDQHLNAANASAEWEKWISRLENLFVALDIDNAERKKALVLYYAGDATFDIFENLPALTAEEAGEMDEYRKCKAMLAKYFKPRNNFEINVFKFHKMNQDVAEPFDNFVVRLREMAKQCDFHDSEKEIKRQILMGCRSKKLRRDGLTNEGWTLNKVIQEGQNLEASELQAGIFEGARKLDANVQNVQKYRPKNETRPQSGFNQSKTGMGSKLGNSKTCYCCGGKFPHIGGKTACPAFGKTCAVCKKQSHFAKMCKSKTRSVQACDNDNDISDDNIENASSSDNDGDILYVNAVNNPIMVMVELKIGHKNGNIAMELDTGSAVSLMGK